MHANQDRVVVDLSIIPIDIDNYSEISRIYQEGIDTGMSTFETLVPSWQRWNDSHLPFGRIACEVNGQIQAWAALSPVSSRCVYGGVAEVSVYVAASQRGRGLGKLLLNQLIEISEKNGIWTLQSSIFEENITSLNLHLACGFRRIGYKEKIGCLNGTWHNNILLEKRSSIVGI